jgi:DNA transformation protein and related proteins
MIEGEIGSFRDLTDLPNISIALAEDLRRIGVSSPRELAAIGAETAWHRLRCDNRQDCIQTLLALGGAILGVAWRALPADRRFELMHYAAHALSAEHLDSTAEEESNRSAA